MRRTSAQSFAVGGYFYLRPVRRPQNKGGWVLGRGGPNKLFPQKNVLPEMAQEEEKKVKQNIFWPTYKTPVKCFDSVSLYPADIKKLYDVKNIK